MSELAGKRALVCGSSQGIGRAAAEAMAQAGASVLLLARNAGALAEVHAQLSSDGGQTHEVLVADFSDPETVEATVAGAVAAGGPIEVLVNNTGGPAGGPLLDATPDQFLEAIDMHLGVSHRLVRKLVPGMKDRGYGRILNVTSTSVRVPIVGLGVSNTVRAAVHNWVRTLAYELGPHGITVNNVLPGFTDTQRLRSLVERRAERDGVPQDQVMAAWQAKVPLRRFAAPAEVAAALRFLASPAAGYITGIDLPVDGGRLAAQG